MPCRTRRILSPTRPWHGLFDRLDEVIAHECQTIAQRESAKTLMRALIGGASRNAWQCGGCGRLYVHDGRGAASMLRAGRRPDIPRGPERNSQLGNECRVGGISACSLGRGSSDADTLRQRLVGSRIARPEDIAGCSGEEILDLQAEPRPAAGQLKKIVLGVIGHRAGRLVDDRELWIYADQLREGAAACVRTDP